MNDHQWEPEALYAATDLDRARKVTLPDPAALPYDLLIRGDSAYLLAATKLSTGRYTIRVYTSRDLTRWQELFRFSAESFARSFEEYDGDFYFGLGCNTDNCPAASGDILRVRRSAYLPPPRAPGPVEPSQNVYRVFLPAIRAVFLRATDHAATASARVTNQQAVRG